MRPLRALRGTEIVEGKWAFRSRLLTSRRYLHRAIRLHPIENEATSRVKSQNRESRDFRDMKGAGLEGDHEDGAGQRSRGPPPAVSLISPSLVTLLQD